MLAFLVKSSTTTKKLFRSFFGYWALFFLDFFFSQIFRFQFFNPFWYFWYFSLDFLFFAVWSSQLSILDIFHYFSDFSRFFSFIFHLSVFFSTLLAKVFISRIFFFNPNSLFGQRSYHGKVQRWNKTPWERIAAFIDSFFHSERATWPGKSSNTRRLEHWLVRYAVASHVPAKRESKQRCASQSWCDDRAAWRWACLPAVAEEERSERAQVFKQERLVDYGNVGSVPVERKRENW